MFDNSKLTGRIIERFKTRSAFAKELGISISSVSGKLRGRHPWTSEEIAKMIKILEIPAAEISEYFFKEKVR